MTWPPSLNEAFNLARVAASESARTPSSWVTTTGGPLRCGMDTGTISALKRPALCASAARWLERTESASASARDTPWRSATISPVIPMDMSLYWSQRPSCCMWSTSLPSPNLMPVREPIRRCGAFDIDSMPPATTTVRSPALMACAASMMALSPEPHTLLMVTEGTESGIPPHSAAARAGFCPRPACRTLPRMTSSTCSGLRPARWTASLTTIAPSWVAVRLDRAPWNFPTGVRHPATMTAVSATILATWCGVLKVQESDGAASQRRGGHGAASLRAALGLRPERGFFP